MPHKDPAERRRYHRAYRQAHGEELNRHNREYLAAKRETDPEAYNASKRDRRRRKRATDPAWAARDRAKSRLRATTNYLRPEVQARNKARAALTNATDRFADPLRHDINGFLNVLNNSMWRAK